MVTKRQRPSSERVEAVPTPATTPAHVSTDPDALLAAALARGGDVMTTGRYLVTFKEGAAESAVQHLEIKRGMRVAHARDFTGQAVALEQAGDADALVFPDINVALIGESAAQERSMTAAATIASDEPFHSIDPEYFVFSDGINAADYLKGVLHTAQMISRDLGLREALREITEGPTEAPEVVGVTWGLIACNVPASQKDGNGIKIAVLDTGFDLGHPEFAGRPITTNTFVGDPVQDLHGHGTHTAGTACGPSAPPGPVQRYGIASKSQMFCGKVLSNSGNGTQGQSLAGINWAVSNKCEVISMSLGAPVGEQPAYTAAGQAALNNGCLIIAAAGNSGPGPTGAPANSPTIVSVAAVDSNLNPAPFSCRGKVDIAGPGVNVFSSWLRPLLHNTISGTSMATPHVSGCAALWAQTSPTLRGAALRAKLFSTAKPLPFPASIVGAGLVQAP